MKRARERNRTFSTTGLRPRVLGSNPTTPLSCKYSVPLGLLNEKKKKTVTQNFIFSARTLCCPSTQLKDWFWRACYSSISPSNIFDATMEAGFLATRVLPGAIGHSILRTSVKPWYIPLSNSQDPELVLLSSHFCVFGFVLLNQYWGIVTVPGSFLKSGDLGNNVSAFSYMERQTNNSGLLSILYMERQAKSRKKLCLGIQDKICKMHISQKPLVGFLPNLHQQTRHKFVHLFVYEVIVL